MKKVITIMWIWAAAATTYGRGNSRAGGIALTIHTLMAVKDTLPVTYYKDRQGIPLILPHATHTYPPLPVNPVRPNNPPYPALGNPSHQANPLYPGQQHNPAYPATPATPLYPNNPASSITPVSPASPISFPTGIPLAPVRPD